MTTLSAHSGATYEAGGTGLPRGEHIEGVAVNDRRDQAPARGASHGKKVVVINMAGRTHSSTRLAMSRASERQL